MSDKEQIKVYYYPERDVLYLIEENDFFLKAQVGLLLYETLHFKWHRFRE